MRDVTKFLYDVALAGGSGSGGGGGSADWPVVTVTDGGAVTQELAEKTVYMFVGNLTSLTITLGASSSQLPHYHFSFVSGATAPTLSMPSGVTMPDSFTVEANKLYEVDVFGGLGAVQSWSAGNNSGGGGGAMS